MPKITCLTDHYACADFSVSEGESVEVSDEKAAQLQSDFPDWFKVEKAGGRPRSTEAQPATTDAPTKRTRTPKAS